MFLQSRGHGSTARSLAHLFFSDARSAMAAFWFIVFFLIRLESITSGYVCRSTASSVDVTFWGEEEEKEKSQDLCNSSFIGVTNVIM